MPHWGLQLHGSTPPALPVSPGPAAPGELQPWALGRAGTWVVCRAYPHGMGCPPCPITSALSPQPHHSAAAQGPGVLQAAAVSPPSLLDPMLMPCELPGAAAPARCRSGEVPAPATGNTGRETLFTPKQDTCWKTNRHHWSFLRSGAGCPTLAGCLQPAVTVTSIAARPCRHLPWLPCLHPAGAPGVPGSLGPPVCQG